MRRTKRPPANPTTHHQMDELFIDHMDYAVDFDVRWTLDEDGDGKPLGYQIDEIVIRNVRRFDEPKYEPIEAGVELRNKLEETIRFQEERYGTLTDEANRQSEPEDRDDLDDEIRR